MQTRLTFALIIELLGHVANAINSLMRWFESLALLIHRMKIWTQAMARLSSGSSFILALSNATLWGVCNNDSEQSSPVRELVNLK